MHHREKAWKDEADRLLIAADFPFAEAARLAATIADTSRDEPLAAVASQALPSLKAAAAERSDSFRREVARRRFSLLRDGLHRLTGPHFGRRRQRPAGIRASSGLDPERSGRRVLGLPEDGALTTEDVMSAFKRVAMSAHPDHGGDTEAFAEAVAARDRLLGRR